MGQVCSTDDRRKKLQRSVRNAQSYPELPSHSRIQPPPYTSIHSPDWKRDSFLSNLRRSTISLQENNEKGKGPDLEDHPALRNFQSSVTGSSFNFKISDPNFPSSVPENNEPARPKPIHRRNVSFLDPTPLNSPSSSTLPSYSTSPKLRIHANSVPQWRWTNQQCRTWITDVLVVYGGKDAQTARELASTFRGFGPNLYMNEWKQWNSWLVADGQAIFALLMEVHDEKGAVPREVEIAHYRRESIVAWGQDLGELWGVDMDLG